MNTKTNIKSSTIFKSTNHNYPIIFSSPHSGRFYPKYFINDINVSLFQLRCLEDMYVDKIVYPISKKLNISFITANFSRAFLDVNRNENEIDPSMFEDKLVNENIITKKVSAGFGLIPKRTLKGKKIYRTKIKNNELVNRLNEVYYPWHKDLKKLINHVYKKFNFCLLVDFHSMPSNIEYGSLSNRSEICISNLDEKSCSSEITLNLADEFKSLGYNVTINYPFKGGYIVDSYSDKKGLMTLQLEIRRDIYMDENKLVLKNDFKKIKSDFYISISNFSNLLKDNCFDVAAE